MIKPLAAITLLTTLLLHSCSSKNNSSFPQIGDIEYKTIDGKTQTLTEIREKDLRGRIYFFIGTQCPEANRYLPKISRLAPEFKKRGIELVGIYPTTEERLTQVQAHINKMEITFPVVKDWEQKLTKHLGGKVLSQAILVSDENRIIYSGRVDDQIGVGVMRDTARSNDLLDAVNQYLSGGSVSPNQQPASGCMIGLANRTHGDAPAKISFKKDVAKIFKRHCTTCHSVHGTAPFSLANLDEIRPFAASIRSTVLEETMPPWHAESGPFEFMENRALSLDDKKTILQWIDQGGHLDTKDRTKITTSRKSLGSPSWVFKAPKEIIGASQTTFFKVTKLELPNAGDTYLRGVVIEPSNRRVVHHVSLLVQLPFGDLRPDQLPRKEFSPSYMPGMLPWIEIGGSYTQGRTPKLYPDGYALVVPPKSKLLLSVHYTPTGRQEEDQTTVNFYFSKTKPRVQIRAPAIAQNNFLLEPNKSNQKFKSQYTFDKDSEIFMLSPHAHYRASSFSIELKTPDEKIKTILSVPKYDSAYQVLYHPKAPIEVRAGSEIICNATFDNSEKNPVNPDPNAAVKFGLTPQDEMMFCFLNFAEKSASRQPERNTIPNE